MMSDRGQKDLDDALIRLTEEDAWSALLRSSGNPSSVTIPVAPPGLLLMVCLVPRPTANLLRTEIKKHLQPYPHEGTRDIILVVLEKAPNFEQNITKLQTEFSCRMQLFLLAELQFNLSQHHLVPRHVKVTDTQEIREIMTTYCLRAKHQLPLILHTDPMARYLDLRPGDIVRVHRNSPTSGDFVAYRCCV
jgi:DNA-directed RNA polymerase subunit H (RpoH/RPB5)